MKNPDWLPFVGWSPLTKQLTLELDLDPSYTWKGFTLAWFNYGIILAVKAEKKE